MTARYVQSLPWVAIVVDVLRVATNSNTNAACNTGVDGVDRAERVSDDLVVCKRLVRAWLECGRVAGGRRIEEVNASEDAVGVLARASATSVGKNIGTGPVGLKETENIGCLRIAVRA